MSFVLRCAAATCTAALLAAGPIGASANTDRAGADREGRGSERNVELNPLDSYETGVFDESAAEIPAFDPGTDRTFVVNAQSGTVDILHLNRRGVLSSEGVLDPSGVVAADGSTIPSGAVVNSVDVARGIVAVTVEAPNKVDLGWVALFDSAQLDVLGAVRVGAQPDSIALTGKARQAVVANEGEPGDDYEVDPEGSISVIDLPKSTRYYDRLDQDDVDTVRFTAYDQGTPLPDGVRTFGPDVPVPAGQPEAGYVARNLEPEYVTIDKRGRTAYVSIQEANAIAVVDLRSATLRDLWALDLSDWSAPGAVLDVSDRDDAINLASWPVFGVPMPDGIDTYRYRGKDLVVTANEGDAREFGDYEEPVRIGDDDYPLCADVFDSAALKTDEALGRLEATTADGLRRGEDCYEQIQVFGGRSFSIYTADGDLVFDSAGMIEEQIADLIVTGELPESAFNSNNDETPSFDSRSDAKGPEPEAVVTGRIKGATYAFVALERVGGVMVFDITDPAHAHYVDYATTRDFSVEVDGAAAPGMGDLGPEGLEFVPAQESPTKQPLLIVANEVSGSTTVYAVASVR